MLALQETIMKKLLIIISVFLATNWMQLNGQIKLQGYIILKATDTVKGKVALPLTQKKEIDYQSMGESVQFEDNVGKSQIYSPKKISGYGIHEEDYNYDFVSYNTNPSGTRKAHVFLNRVVDGDLQLFEAYHHNYIPMGTHGALRQYGGSAEYYILINNFPEEPFLKDEDDDIIRNIENLKTFLKDYPELLQKIIKDLRWSELKEMVIAYNETKKMKK